MIADPPVALTLGLGRAGALILLLATAHRHGSSPLHLAAAVLLGIVAGWAEDRVWWLAVLAVGQHRRGHSGSPCPRWPRQARGGSPRKADQLAVQVDRRISELFSLQELSYVLSKSIQLDRIVEQVAKYAARFLQADGAIVVLVEGEGRGVRIVAASGTLEPVLGRESRDPETALVRVAIGGDRIEVAQEGETPKVNLIGGLLVRSAAVVPLQAQGLTIGVLAVTDRRGGPFTTEDLWLLSTVATNASVVLANSRLYEMVRRSEEEWEITFNALAEGIAVVGPTGAILRANLALAGVAELPEAELVGRNFADILPGDRRRRRRPDPGSVPPGADRPARRPAGAQPSGASADRGAA